MKKCSYCGRENSDDAAHCSGCGTEFENLNPLPIIPKQDKLTKAGFWIRALARIIDGVFGLFIGLMAGVLAGFGLALLKAAGALSPGWQYRIHGFSLMSLAFGFLGITLYHFFCEGIYGATLGKLCCGIRVVSEDGSPCNLKGALIRTLAYYIDALFFGLVGYNSMEKSALNQRYGDVWGKTAVFKTSEIAPESERSAMRLALSLFLGIGCWIAMVATGLVLKAL